MTAQGIRPLALRLTADTNRGINALKWSVEADAVSPCSDLKVAHLIGNFSTLFVVMTISRRRHSSSSQADIGADDPGLLTFSAFTRFAL